MPLIFISRASANDKEALALEGWLADNGWDDVFLDTDGKSGTAAGRRWQSELRRAASLSRLGAVFQAVKAVCAYSA